MHDRCKQTALGVVFVVLTLPVLAQQKPAEALPIPVKTAAETRETLNIDVTTVGTLRADETVMIRPEIAGRVATLHFKEGQAVSDGDPLVTLDQGEYQAQLAGSTAQVGLEEISYQRLRDLQRKNLSSTQVLDETKARLDAARAAQTLTQIRLEKTVIRAPFSGTVGLRLVSPGAYVKSGDDITNLESLGAMKLDFRVPETYLALLATGKTLTVRVDAWPNQGLEGTIYAINPAVDPETRTVLLRARVPNKGNKLCPGLFARVNLVLERRENALIAPEQAIMPLGRTTFVYRLVDSKVVMTPVKLGLRRPGKVEILEGLSAGDQVVTDGQLKIRDGTAVTVLPPPVTPSASGRLLGARNV